MGRFRRSLLMMLAGAIVGLPQAPYAQTLGKAHRIGFLSMGSAPGPSIKSFLERLRDLGYVEGTNLVMEYRWAGALSERLPELANELVRAKVDIIVTSGTTATIAAKRATQTIPIVFASMASPEERGVVASLARPGRNVTGLAFSSQANIIKIIEMLKATAPKVSRVGFFYDPAIERGQTAEILQDRIDRKSVV